MCRVRMEVRCHIRLSDFSISWTRAVQCDPCVNRANMTNGWGKGGDKVIDCSVIDIGRI